jgi:lipoate-protein ligase A
LDGRHKWGSHSIFPHRVGEVVSVANWRLLKIETHDAFMNMAIDEAILTERVRNEVPNTVRLYRWKPSAVSIGKFQNIGKEIYSDHCRKLGVQIVRRPSGGGTVYHDSDGEITYSMIADKSDLGIQDITMIYAKAYVGLTMALRRLGINADFNEGNAKTCPNLTVDGKKISGSSQCHRKNVVLQHGTLLIDVDFERMFTVLRVPWSNSCIQVSDVAKEKITSINLQTRRNATVEQVNDALVYGFSKAINAKLVGGKLTKRETKIAQELYERKYTSNEWNLRGEAS